MLKSILILQHTRVDPYAKFDRKIKENSVPPESSEWKEFFDTIGKKEEIDCKKIIQLGKKIHVLFSFAQTWNFFGTFSCKSEQEGYKSYEPEGFKGELRFKGYLIGGEFLKKIRKEVRIEINKKYFKLNYFEDWLSECELEFGTFVERNYFEDGRLLTRDKFTMVEILQRIKEELNRFAKGASEPEAEGGSDPAGGGYGGAGGSKGKGQKKPRKKRSDAGQKRGAKGSPEEASGSGAKGGSDPVGGDGGADGSKNKGQKRPRKKRSDAGKKRGAKGGPEGALGSGAKGGSDPAGGGDGGADGSKNKILGSDSDSE